MGAGFSSGGASKTLGAASVEGISRKTGEAGAGIDVGAGSMVASGAGTGGRGKARLVL